MRQGGTKGKKLEKKQKTEGEWKAEKRQGGREKTRLRKPSSWK